MAEYIERTEELILAVNAGARAIENTKKYHSATYCIGVFSDNPREISYLKAADVLRGIDEIPAADVAPVVHGRWVESVEIQTDTSTLYDYTCSECSIVTTRESPYCPNCGAQMKDGE